MDKNISTLLREIKEATGWSEPKIAAELGTSQPTVNRILNGQGECKVSTFRAITELHSSTLNKAARRATDPTPESTRTGRTPASPHNILDTVPERAVIAPPGDKA